MIPKLHYQSVFKEKEKEKQQCCHVRSLSDHFSNILPRVWTVIIKNTLTSLFSKQIRLQIFFSKSLNRWVLIPKAQSKQRRPGIPVKTPTRGAGLSLLPFKQQQTGFCVCVCVYSDVKETPHTDKEAWQQKCFFLIKTGRPKTTKKMKQTSKQVFFPKKPSADIHSSDIWLQLQKCDERWNRILWFSICTIRQWHLVKVNWGYVSWTSVKTEGDARVCVFTCYKKERNGTCHEGPLFHRYWIPWRLSNENHYTHTHKSH